MTSVRVAEFTGEIHEAAAIWPMMSDDELDAMAVDIADHGLKSPIILDPDGRLLDGRNRLAACKRANVDPRFITYKGSNLVAFVVSVNAHRRHLTPSQKAMAAQDVLPLFEAEAEARMTAGKAADPTATLPEGRGEAREKAARTTGASARNVSKAKKIAEADPELADKVRAGEVSVDAAAKQVAEKAKFAETMKAADKGAQAISPSYASSVARARIAKAAATTWSKALMSIKPAFIAEHANDETHRRITDDLAAVCRWCDETEAALNQPLAAVVEMNR